MQKLDVDRSKQTKGYSEIGYPLNNLTLLKYFTA